MPERFKTVSSLRNPNVALSAHIYMGGANSFADDKRRGVKRHSGWIERHRADNIDAVGDYYFFYGLFLVANFVCSRRFFRRISTRKRDVYLVLFGEPFAANQIINQIDGRVFHRQRGRCVVDDFQGKQRKGNKHRGKNKGLDLSKQRPLTDCVNRLPYVAFILFWLFCQGVTFVVPVMPLSVHF